MVARKPLPSSPVPPPLRQAANNPPYPTESTMPGLGQAGVDGGFAHAQEHNVAAPERSGQRSRASSIASIDTWNTDPSEPEEREAHHEQLPETLRPGLKTVHVSGGELQSSASAWRDNSSLDRPPPGLQSQNPYLNFKVQETANGGVRPASQSSNQPGLPLPSEELASLMLDSPWEQEPKAAPKHNPPPPPPFNAPQPPRPSSAGMTLAAPSLPPLSFEHTGSHSSTSSNPWQDDLDRVQEQSKTGAPDRTPPDYVSLAPPSLLGRPQTPQHRPPLPLRLDNLSDQAIGRPEVETPRAQARRQRGESYHIKHVRWYDARAQGGRGALRISPILTQNSNGPCPILALVNTLSLSTPENEESALLDALRPREQVTLGLLLDAVFEELVRRNENTGNELPDIGELYAFLITLHTGMNVNPAFTKQLASQPGTFEQTKEMRLYSAFQIPLIHGWIPPFGSETYQAFERSAKTFDEALNVQFLEEEFNLKLQADGLNREEQQMFEDLTAVKEFLVTFPTQLSNDGLEVLNSWITPGHFAILFRNDHFCTLYREPKDGTLMTLVTDAGYSTHDEIVWESLVDVNGAMAGFFSGDFRPVGSSRQPSDTPAPRRSWQSDSKHRRSLSNNKGADSTTSLTSPVSTAQSRAEQEDLDLALALQLQEEEEEASRREEARRQDAHNESLSRQYLDQQSFDQPEQRPPIPPRRSPGSTSAHSTQGTSNGQNSQVYNSSARTDDGNAPPPTYEQAASDPIYREAGSTPQPPRQGNALGALNALGVQGRQSAFGNQSSQQGPPSYGRRPSGRLRTYSSSPQQGTYAQTGNGSRYGEAQDDRCTVM